MRSLQSCTVGPINADGEISTEPARSASPSVLRLLVVDPEPEVCRSIGEVAATRFLVASAASSKDALHQLELSEFDLVLLDVARYGNDALTLLKEITLSYPRTDVVVMTSFATAATAMEAMRALVKTEQMSNFERGEAEMLKRAFAQMEEPKG